MHVQVHACMMQHSDNESVKTLIELSYKYSSLLKLNYSNIFAVLEVTQ